MKKYIIILLLLFTAPVSSWAQSEDNYKKLEDLVKTFPKGHFGPDYWFEMKSAIGWEKMILVMGYADDRSICLLLKRMGEQQSPDREFRCVPAN